MNKVCFICYILWYNSNLKPLLKGGVPKSCKEVFKFGPRRMSTGGLNNKRYNIVVIVTPLRWREAYLYLCLYLYLLLQILSGGGRQEENECERNENPLAVWLRNVPVWLTEERRCFFSPDSHTFSSPAQWELFKSGFTMRSNPGLTVTPATLTGSGTSRTTPGLE